MPCYLQQETKERTASPPCPATRRPATAAARALVAMDKQLLCTHGTQTFDRQRNGPASTEELSVQSFKLLTLLSADAFCFLLSMLREGGRRRVQTAECRGWWAMAWQHGGEPGPGRGSFIGRGPGGGGAAAQACAALLGRCKKQRGAREGGRLRLPRRRRWLRATAHPLSANQVSESALLYISLSPRASCSTSRETSALHTYIKSIL